ncbi:hypothetical protein ACF3NA_00220 [Alkanindiges sp. WGS2144]|uniref:hypothetical protein n=1 Tax=Alkanindiges sp. WGS2144 TaxID=3366808 RepID=UPI003753D27C
MLKQTCLLSLGVLAGAALLMAGCASSVKPIYVSPTQYQALNCQQLHAEYARIGQYIQRGVSSPKTTGVGVGLGVGGIFGRGGGWGIGPSVSVNMGQSQRTQNSELARVLGEQEAIAQAAQFKGCPIAASKRS